MLIRQLASGRWELASADGTAIQEFDTYDAALAFISGAITYQAAVDGVGLGDPASSTLLPESWMSDQGICFSEATTDGRDFSQCQWSWRDPNMSLLPLMLQTETEIGHFGAELAGFMQELHMVGTTPQASGRFYATDTGRTARDLLADGRRFGVSVDATNADVEWTCIEEDEDGYCLDGVATFNAYEIGGLTATPFPAFPNASIILAPTTIMASADAGSILTEPLGFPTGTRISDATTALRDRLPSLRAGTALLDRPTVVAPSRDFFEMAEPALGEPFALGSLGDEWLIDQGAGNLAMPLHIDPDGSRVVAGHLAYWSQCHVGFPGQCITPPESMAAYAHFHVGETLCADGTTIATGSLTASCDHAVRQMRARAAQDHYAHNGIAWANVRVTNGVYGPWVTGALRADVTDEQIAVLRAGALSGDWRRLGGNLELIGALAVTGPGFPIAREALIASGLEIPQAPHVSTYTSGGELQALVASGIVRRCPDCARRSAEAASGRPGRIGTPESLSGAVDTRLARIEATLGMIERRTRPMVDSAAAHLAAQIRQIS